METTVPEQFKKLIPHTHTKSPENKDDNDD